jgi:hypothetical protein
MRFGAVGLGILLVAAACGGSATFGTGGSGAGGSGGSGGSGAGPVGPGSGAGPGSGGSGAAWGSCVEAGECVLSDAGCCGSCGEQTLEGSVALNQGEVDAYYASLMCDNVGCPDCYGWPNANLFATCEAGHCQKYDVRQHDLSACGPSDTCVLRWGLDCCPGCSSPMWVDEHSGLVAVRQGAPLADLVCLGDVACDECAPQFPADAIAECIEGHCQVVFAL